MSSDWALFLNDDTVNTVSRAAATLYFFEYAITLDREMDYIWRRRFSGATALVVVNRYAMLAASIVNLVQSIPRSHYFLVSLGAMQGCQSLVRFIDVCTFFMYTSYALFAALRMYALYGMRKGVFILVLLVGSLSPVVQITLMCLGTIESNSGRGDVIDIPMCTKVTDGYAPSVLIVTLRAVALCFEALLLVLTWCKTIALWRTLKQTTSTSLSAMILRDGTMYFIIITIALALNLHATTGLFDYTTYISVPLYDLTPMVDTITSICMTRFILNLRSVNTASETESGLGTSRRSTVRFANADVIVGNLGAQLRDTFDDYDEEWEEEVEGAVEDDDVLSIGGSPGIETGFRTLISSGVEA